jgi:mono/diheme cytochrome c family protein
MGSLAMFAVLAFSPLQAQNQAFHNAPASAREQKNPYAGQAAAARAGRIAYAQNCGSCHGRNGGGTGNIPSLAKKTTQSATDGEIFWFITKGDVANGMPAWDKMPEPKRWQIVTYVKSLRSQPAAPAGVAAAAIPLNAPPPSAPFTDYRFEKPGNIHKITVKDLPAPFATPSAPNAPEVVQRPANAWPKAPAGFKVQLYVTGLNNPRLIRTAPNGDFFVAESEAGDIKVFRGITGAGRPTESQVFVT